ncbi:MAG: U32 family peptidase [Clostridiales bacterium]|nr:U32 family peptidase [Clostridiales bacterium]
MKKATPELLAPAGSMAALEAAIDGGADAVYFGTDAFNARMRADNFRDGEPEAALALCRAFGVRAYITLNTRLLDRQLPEALQLACRLWGAGADAFIVADAGLAAALREQIPGVVLHASTQMSGHTEYDAAALKEAGFSRMVCPRELSQASLARLCSRSPIPIEMFVHGAHCVSFSGQCLMSAVMGGRSGNQGSCAQPCRLPYTLRGKKGYLLSLRDLCLAAHIPQTLELGVSSLKIEGRQKSPEYVHTVVSIYRKLLDQRRAARPDELDTLQAAFSRSGFTDGYFTGTYQNMLGVRTLEEFHRKQQAAYAGLSRRVPLDISLTIQTGELAVLTAVSPEKTVTVCGDETLMEGDVPPPDETSACKNAGRLGGTPFRLDAFHYQSDGKALFTLSMLNRLRRKAVEALLAPPVRERTGAVQKADIPFHGNKKPVFTASFLSPGQVTPLAQRFFSEIYLPYTAPLEGAGIELPPILLGEDFEKIWQTAEGAPYVLVHTPGQLLEAVRRGIPARASIRFNVYNSRTAGALAAAGAAGVDLSPELSLPQMRDLQSPVPKGAVVYGRLPLMLTVRCALSDGGSRCGSCGGNLVDRKGAAFPVTETDRCGNIIWNSVPIYMADRLDAVRAAGIVRMHFLFTTESGSECDQVIRAYEAGTAPAGQILRMKK